MCHRDGRVRCAGNFPVARPDLKSTIQVGILKDVLISLGAVSILDPLSAPLSVPQSRCSSLTGTVLLHGIDHIRCIFYKRTGNFLKSPSTRRHCTHSHTFSRGEPHALCKKPHTVAIRDSNSYWLPKTKVPHAPHTYKSPPTHTPALARWPAVSSVRTEMQP